MKSLIKKYLREAIETDHFKKRLRTRFYNDKSYQTTNVPDKLTPISYEKAKYYLEILKNIDFPKKTEFAVAIGYSPLQDKTNPRSFTKANGFYYYDKNARHEEDSWGHIIWVVVKDNSLVTLTLHRGDLKDKTTGRPYQKISMERLITYINKVKKPESSKDKIELSKEDFEFMKNADFKPLNKNEVELKFKDKIYVIDMVGKVFYPQYLPKEAQDIESYFLAIDKLVGEDKANDDEIDLALELSKFI